MNTESSRIHVTRLEVIPPFGEITALCGQRLEREKLVQIESANSLNGSLCSPCKTKDALQPKHLKAFSCVLA